MGRRFFAALVFLLIVGAAAAGGWWLVQRNTGPFAGEIRHDFGTVEIVGVDAVATHTFVLTNQTDETLRILKAVPNCSCAYGDYDRNLVPPGESVNVQTSLSLDANGPKKAYITVLTDDESKTILRLEAIGRKNMAIAAEPKLLPVRRGQPSTLTITVARSHADGEPPAVDLQQQKSRQFEVVVEPWVAGTRMEDEVWRAAIVLTPLREVVETGTYLVANVEGLPELIIPTTNEMAIRSLTTEGRQRAGDDASSGSGGAEIPDDADGGAPLEIAPPDEIPDSSLKLKEDPAAGPAGPGGAGGA